MKFAAGDRFGDLAIERIIGSGAYGTVYAARDELLRRNVALKVVRTAGADPVDRERVIAEARLVGALQSPSVATLYRIHELPDGAGWALELEYVDGRSLAEMVKDGARLGVVEALRIFMGIIAALRDAHAAGIVHGDIKPANVVLDGAGEVKVVDFGVARMLGDAAQDARLRGQVGGTPAYMAPEVVMGDPPRPASDLWSAAVVLHRLLTGAPPFRSATIAELLPSILNDTPRPLPDGVPAPVAAIVTRCLDKDPERRPPAEEAFLGELARGLDGAVREQRRRELRDGGAGALPGRGDALAVLAAAIDDTCAGSGRTLVIEASTGYGVSALLAAVASMADKAGLCTVSMALAPESGVSQRMAEAIRHDGSDVALSAESSRVLSQPSHARPRAILGAIEEWIRGVLRDRPVALLLDDVHHASPTDRRLLQELSRRLEKAGVLIVLGRRTRDAGEAPFFDPNVPHERVVLGPLPPAALDALLVKLGGGSPLDAELVSRIYRSTEGNPFFATELFNHLRKTRAITLRGGRWRPQAGTSLTIPERLEQLVTDRLEALSPSLREVLDVAAVDGRSFDGAAIAAVLDRSRLDVLRALQRLYRDYDFVAPVESGYRFRHELARDAIYRSIEPALRTGLHRRLATHLEARRDDISGERIGVHWEAAGDREKAAPHLRRAMMNASTHHDLYRALDFAERAGLLGSACDPSILDDPTSWRTLTNLLAAAGRMEELHGIYDTLLAHVRATGDTENLFAILIQRVRQLYVRARATDLRLDEIRAMLPDRPEDRTAAWARVCLGRAATMNDEMDAAMRHLDQALEISRRFDGAEPFVPAAASLADGYERVGRHEEAEALYREGAERCAEYGQRGTEAIHLANMTLCSVRRGMLDGAVPTLRSALVAIALGQAPTAHAHGGLELARVLYASGDTAAASRQAKVSLAQARELAFRPSLTEGGVHAASIAIAMGELEEAGAILDEAIDVAQRAHDETVLPLLHAIDAQRHWLAGEPTQARIAEDALLERIAGATQCDRILAVLPWVSESVVYGMDPTGLDVIQDRVESMTPPELCGRNDLLALAAAAHAFRDRAGSIADLLEGAARLRHPAFGDRQAVLRTLGIWFAAEAARRAGESQKAHALAADALAAARRLGHVWLEADLDRYSS